MTGQVTLQDLKMLNDSPSDNWTSMKMRSGCGFPRSQWTASSTVLQPAITSILSSMACNSSVRLQNAGCSSSTIRTFIWRAFFECYNDAPSGQLLQSIPAMVLEPDDR